MGRSVALQGEGLAWAREEFARYYRTHRVELPPRFTRREFAAFPFQRETVMRRHAAFPTADALLAFLGDVVPRHVYFSSAYYAHPDHPSMAGKEWLGADLIFDLDADHLKRSEGLSYPQQLALVKAQLRRLYDDFLLRDFGIDPAKAPIVFSGGRGYHVHVRDERFLALSSPERRELVDYILGTEVDASAALHIERAKDEEGHRALPFRGLYPTETPGWRGRITRSFFDLLDRWTKGGAELARRELEQAGVEPREAGRWAKRLTDADRVRQIRESLRLDVFKNDPPDALVRLVLRSAAIDVQGETDAPVTTDIHRLIRLPGSLHGGTGFRALPLSRDGLDGFDPFKDAPYSATPDERQRVLLAADVDYPFDGGVRGKEGEGLELASPVALFLLLRGEAALPPSPER